MKNNKKIQFFGILVYFLIASIFITMFKLGYIYGAIIYLIFPSIFITLKNKSIFKKTLIFSIVLSAPLVFVFDYIATMSRAWFEITSSGIRILGTFPIETFVWAASVTYFTISFYEYFYDRDLRKDKFSKNFKYLYYILFLIVLVFSFIYITNKEILIINYFYAYFALGLFILPTIIVLSIHQKLMKKVIYQGLFFLLLSIIYEITAIHAGHWIFPGQYLGFVEILKFRFPLEEFIWLVFCVPATISIYEVFVDDRK